MGTQSNQSKSVVHKSNHNQFTTPIWFAENPSKRWAEIFFLKWSIGWILVFGSVVITKVYENFQDLQYLLLSLVVSVPYVAYPLLFPAKCDANTPLLERYWVKANIWIAILSYVGNYFWTHYFYTVLGAYYTFPVNWQLNRVPIMLYFITHAYFLFYHTCTTIALRRFWTSSLLKKCNKSLWLILTILFIFLMSYFTAFMEAFTIQSVPYYVIQDRKQFYLIGSAVYGIYFYVSFPMFYRVDEKEKWNISGTIIDSLGGCMLVTIFLDLWRLFIGAIVGQGTLTLPWLQTLVQ